MSGLLVQSHDEEIRSVELFVTIQQCIESVKQVGCAIYLPNLLLNPDTLFACGISSLL